MSQRDRIAITGDGNRYGIGIANHKYVLFAAIAPSQCVFGVIWGSPAFELCIGPIVLGVARYAD